jgi:hypothetical protein
MTARTRRIVVGAGLAAVVALSIPLPYQACPSWDVLVVDTSGNPVPGMTVRLSYQDYSIERASHEEDRTTDAQGSASFPGRISRHAYASRAAGAVLSGLNQGVHASFGRHAYVMAFGRGLRGSDDAVTDWTGEPNHMSSKITAKPSQLIEIPSPKKLPLLQ